MKKIYYAIMIVIAVYIPLVLASQEKDIYLDTKGQTGHLIYEEQYYTIKNGNLTIDQTIIYFDGYINKSKIKFMIERPLDGKGNEYLENQIRALAVLDNKTILNTMYVDNIRSDKEENQNAPLIGLLVMVVVIIAVIYAARRIIIILKAK